ncbi:MAG: hypothetical protein JKX92_08575 [Porticoccaceae bacterium]|nr:hypothetical protein [Porticoccaceae bacterium]
MPTAKDDFIYRISNFEKIVSPENSSDSVLVTRALTETVHNEKVRMLRNGMAIIGFTILEDFIKNRISEVLKAIGNSRVNFNQLPSKLKDATTIGALKGIKTRAEVLKTNSSDYITFIQDESKLVSSTQDSVFELSTYSIGWDKSNLSASDISNYLSIFSVGGGWETIQKISAAININLTNPNEIYKNISTRRHKAAHNTNAESLLTDLQDYVSQSCVIAFAFDALISHSLMQINVLNTDFLNENIKTTFDDLSFRFVLEGNNQWKEYKGNSSRAYRVNNILADLLTDAEARAIHNKEFLLIKSKNNQIIDWKNPV